MRYSEITQYPRRWNQEKYPVVAEVEVEIRHRHRVEEAIADQTQTTIIGHDLIGNDRAVIYVGCTSDKVCRAVESAWD